MICIQCNLIFLLARLILSQLDHFRSCVKCFTCRHSTGVADVNPNMMGSCEQRMKIASLSPSPAILFRRFLFSFWCMRTKTHKTLDQMMENYRNSLGSLKKCLFTSQKLFVLILRRIFASVLFTNVDSCLLHADIFIHIHNWNGKTM